MPLAEKVANQFNVPLDLLLRDDLDLPCSAALDYLDHDFGRRVCFQ